jgi:hypothetical protein
MNLLQNRRGARSDLPYSNVAEEDIDAADLKALIAAACARGRRSGDMDENEWWATSGPLLARVLDETAYSIAARVGSAAGAAHGSAYSPGHAYTFGLERVLAGLSQLIDSN